MGNFDQRVNDIYRQLHEYGMDDTKKTVDKYVAGRVTQAQDKTAVQKVGQRLAAPFSKKAKNDVQIRKLQQDIEDELENKVIPDLQNKLDALRDWDPDDLS